MMKIKTESNCILLPVDSGLHLICENGLKTELIDCLTAYFNQKKKSRCVILNDDNEIVDPNEMDFIYVPSNEDYSSTFGFKPKTLLNVELSKIIESNPEMFQSIDLLRKDFRNLLTDVGMIKFMGILKEGLDNHFEITTNNFTLSKMLHALEMKVEYVSIQEQMMTLYNLYLFLNRNKSCIIYIDFLMDYETMNWLLQKRSENYIFLVSNSSIEDKWADLFDSILFMTESDFVEKIEIERKNANVLSYALQPIVMKHPEYQSDKISEIMKLFDDKTINYCIKLVADSSVKAFI